MEPFTIELLIHILDSINDSNQAEKLKEVLLENFAPIHSPEKREVKKLKMVIETLDDIIKNGSNWVDSQRELRQFSEGKSLNLREHPLLAFRQHIQWVYDTFKNIPHVNITFR